MIDRNHPAVEAATPDIHCISLREYEPEDCHEPIADALTAAWPELTTATEDNLARLRNTPAGRALMAEGWEEGAAHAWAITGEGFNGECAFDHLSQRLDDPSSTFREYNPDDRNPYREARP